MRVMRLAALRQVEHLRRPRRDRVERLLPLLDLLPQRIAEVGIAAVEISGSPVPLENVNRRELVWIRDRYGAQTDRVDQLKDRRVRADSQRQRQNSHQRESRAQSQLAQSKL